MKNVVIVESPAKAKTILRYLGDEFVVIASYGHIRDLPSKNGSVMPEKNFSMLWEVSDKAQKHIQEITKAIKKCKNLYLATDPDREGEAISWHICEVLKEKNVLKDHTVQRIVFNEITPKAIQAAIEHPRDISHSQVDAYLARRALDYLYGFSLSPVLWRKLPGARSAGRVQSVALRIVVDREKEIEIFSPQEYWSIHAFCKSLQDQPFWTRLTHLNGKKLDKMSIGKKEEALQAVEAIESRKDTFGVDNVQKKRIKRSPAAPFTTSTLQQEAARKLGFSAQTTMRVAQKLYEGVDVQGESLALITYMRTDSVNLSQDAVQEMRGYIESTFGKNYLPEKVKSYKSKAKNAQEAHEAIRPIAIKRTPQEIKAYLDDLQFKLYELIWKRTLACQMENAEFDQTSVDIASKDKQVALRASGTVLVFDGFLKLYQEGVDDEPETEDDEKRLPLLNEGDQINLKEIKPDQHFTQPPPRFTEASLVKRLEELGIGRPSTYASILSVLQERNYVRLEKKQFIPEERGRLVVSFLTHFFSKYVEYDFTAMLETELDDISQGDLSWEKVMEEFWKPFSEIIDHSKNLDPLEIERVVEQDMIPHLLRESERGCPSCAKGYLQFKISRFGAFLGCSEYPECNYKRALNAFLTNDTLENPEDKEIGIDPDDGLKVLLRKGPYGHYLQWGDDIPKAKKGKGPKRVSIPKDISVDQLTLEMALILKKLPYPLGLHPETQEEMSVGNGRFGPYIKLGDKFISIPKNYNFLDLTLEQAKEIIEKKKSRATNDQKQTKTKTSVRKVSSTKGRKGTS